MPESVRYELPVSDEHRRRRRIAYERAAAAHERAASQHEKAATFFDEHGQRAKRDKHHQAADDERRRAADAHAVADEQ